MHRACERHARQYKDCMNGMGIDRHLFALYVVSKGLDYVSSILVLFPCSGWGKIWKSWVNIY